MIVSLPSENKAIWIRNELLEVFKPTGEALDLSVKTVHVPAEGRLYHQVVCNDPGVGMALMSYMQGYVYCLIRQHNADPTNVKVELI